MKSFWRFAAMLWRRPGVLLAAGACALLSGASLGAGLVGIAPVLETILETHEGLPQLARDFNAALPAWASWLTVPEASIERLPGGAFTAVLALVCVLGLLTLLGGAANFLHQHLALSLVYRTITDVRRHAYHAVLRRPLADVLSRGAADLVSRVVHDTNALGAGLTALLSRALAQVLKGVFSLGAAAVVEWRLTLLALTLGPVLYGVIRKLGTRIRRASRAALESQAGLYAAAAEAVQGLRVVRVHTAERREAARFQVHNERVMRELLRARLARALASPLVEVLTIIVVGALALIAAKAILDQDLAPERFITALLALGVAGAALKPVTGLLHEISASAAGAQRLAELMDTPPEPGRERRKARLAPHSESIAFDRVVYRYPDADAPALRGVSLTIRHGERVALVGPNGSGKTTLMSLVPRLFDPDKGRVLIDGIDLREVGVRSLRRQIGMVTQETVLFAGDIASNIAFGVRRATDEAIREAARRARADEFIDAMPRGYHTRVGEQGMTLSGGQRQRLAIARAILRDPRILLLDEATSMVDAESEARIAEALSEFSRGRTTLVVAHRLSTVVSADRIVVLDQGRVADVGRHAELLARCPIYHDLAKHQLLDSPSR